MVWMCKTGAASAIVTEDSDVFLYCITCGVDSPVLFKLDDSGFVQVRNQAIVNMSSISAPSKLKFTPMPSCYSLYRPFHDQVCARTARTQVNLPQTRLCIATWEIGGEWLAHTSIFADFYSKPIPQEAFQPHGWRQGRHAHVRPVLRLVRVRLSRLAAQHGHRGTFPVQ